MAPWAFVLLLLIIGVDAIGGVAGIGELLGDCRVVGCSWDAGSGVEKGVGSGVGSGVGLGVGSGVRSGIGSGVGSGRGSPTLSPRPKLWSDTTY